jgi:hypothetical protein
MAGRTTLVKSVLTSIDIYFMTILNIPIEVLMKTDIIRRAFLWAACDSDREKVQQRKLGGGVQA